MKKAIAMKWVEALRSGDYEQGTGQLRDSQGNFCCLGVLCNLHAQQFPKVAALQSDPTLYLGKSETLPHQVLEWAEIEDDLGSVSSLSIDDYEYESLADANDSGVDFHGIADWIEENYKKL